MTIGGGGSGGGVVGWSPKRRPERTVVSPTARAAAAAPTAAAAVDGWGSSTAVSGAGEKPAQRAAEEVEMESRGKGQGDDAAWLAKSEEAWEAVPVEAKRECLGNVLLAIAARFPDVGYCQVSCSCFGL